jgi:hypothetical protein
MLYGMDFVGAAARIRAALQEAGIRVAKDGLLYWTTAPIDQWPAGFRGDPWRSYSHPGVYASIVLAQRADTVVVLGSAEALCASSPGAPDSTIAVAVRLYAEEVGAALRRRSPMPASWAVPD